MDPQDFIKVGERTFKLDDQIIFANFSGDHNPIHVDLVEVRKTTMGECIVHGMNGLLWALECLSHACGRVPVKFKIKFQKPLSIDSRLICLWNELKRNVKIQTEENETLFSLHYEEFIDENERITNVPITLTDRLKSPIETDLKNWEEEPHCVMKYGGDATLAETLYPELSRKIGANRVYEISLLSNIVGMQIPGLHSLFLSAVIEFGNNNILICPFFRVDKIDRRFGIIDLEYFGNNLTCRLKALERPHYKTRTCSEIKGKIPRSLVLDRKKILIIGGSRGIGAAVAQVASILGADTTITYNAGASDARRLCADIQAFTMRNVGMMKLDITDMRQIEALKFDYDVLFFFASPKIMATQGEFDLDLFDNFYKIYCKSFQIIARYFHQGGGSLIYWPSTIFLSQDINNFKEYTLAKSIGERVCNSLQRETKMKIIVERLDKIETDQTISLIKEPMLDSIDVAIDITKISMR